MNRTRTFLLVLAAGVLICGGFLVSGALAGEPGKKATAAKVEFDKPPPVGTKAICPVMGTEFSVKKDSKRSEYKGKHYVFCCAGCKPMFDANPEKYIKK